MRRQTADDGPVVHVVVPALDVIWPAGPARKLFSKVKRDYQWYFGIVGDDAGQPADVLADIVHDNDDVIKQETLCERDGGSFLAAYDRSSVSAALPRLSKTVLTSCFDFASLVKGLVDEMETT